VLQEIKKSISGLVRAKESDYSNLKEIILEEEKLHSD